MSRYAALLGSINVGGNRLKMDELRGAMEQAGFASVETVVASGNVLFDHPGAPDEALELQIAALVKNEFSIASLVFVLTADELRRAVSDNPFNGDGEDKFVHTIFLDGQPDGAKFEALLAEHRTRGSERLALGERMLFLDYLHGAGVSSLTGPFLQRRLGCRGTARNMRSLKRIVAKMEESD